jgi:hypothetical protein
VTSYPYQFSQGDTSSVGVTSLVDGGEKAKHLLLARRKPALEELQAERPGENNLDDFRIISMNPRDYDVADHEVLPN